MDKVFPLFFSGFFLKGQSFNVGTKKKKTKDVQTIPLTRHFLGSHFNLNNSCTVFRTVSKLKKFKLNTKMKIPFSIMSIRI